MATKEQEIIEKIETILKNEKFPSRKDILGIKKNVMEIIKAINNFEAIEKNDDESEIQIARELIAQANITFAITEFANSDAVKNLL